jgi:hypothetical protein
VVVGLVVDLVLGNPLAEASVERGSRSPLGSCAG